MNNLGLFLGKICRIFKNFLKFLKKEDKIPIKFVPKEDLSDCEIELNFEMLGINNFLIYTTKYIQVENNKVIFLNAKKKILGEVYFESEERAVNFFNFTTFMIGFKIIFKDKFAIKED